MKWNLVSKTGYLMAFGFFLFHLLVAQNYIVNHRKYWFYKSRLNNDFIKVGTGDGESLIFNERGFGVGKDADGKDIDMVATSWNDPVASMKIGDGTSTLGYYIAQLALEYYLLRLNNQKTDSTLYELACAMYAINRLDLKAEMTLGSTNCSPLLNGFFIRDDVPCNFIRNNYDHFNYFSAGINNNLQSRGFASYFQFGVDSLTSGWCDNYEKKNYQFSEAKKTLFYISQDQVYNLLYGLAFVRKFVPTGVEAKDRQGNTFWFQDGQKYISEEAKSIAKRIIDNIRNSKKCDGSGCPGDDWDIKFPHNCETPTSKGWIDPFAYSLGESECVVDHLKFGNSFIKNACSISKCAYFPCSAQYHTFFSLTGGKILWNNNLLVLSSTNTSVMKGNMLAVCNCYYFNFINKSDNMIDIVANVGNYYWYLFHQPLSRYLLHGGSLKINNGGGWKDNPVFLLNEMNPCNHFNLGKTTNYSSLGWSTDTRLDHPERIGNNTFRGEYPSIDYMLYFNLWTTKTVYDNPGGIYPNYINLSHYYINSSNLFNGGFGYYNPPSDWQINAVNYKIQIDAYETIFIEKTKMPFYTNENYMRAGKEIIIKATNTPGDGSETVIKPGIVLNHVSDGTSSNIDNSGIRFYIKKYDCATDNGSFNPNVDPSYSYRTLNSDTLFVRKMGTAIRQDEVKDSLIINPRPHYIEYPDKYQILNIDNTVSMSMDSAVFFNNQSIYIVPNPAIDNIKMTLSENIKCNKVEIINVVGEIVDRIIFDPDKKEFEIHIHSLKSGFYLINLYYNENFIISSKFIKK